MYCGGFSILQWGFRVAKRSGLRNSCSPCTIFILRILRGYESGRVQGTHVTRSIGEIKLYRYMYICYGWLYSIWNGKLYNIYKCGLCKYFRIRERNRAVLYFGLWSAHCFLRHCYIYSYWWAFIIAYQYWYDYQNDAFYYVNMLINKIWQITIARYKFCFH